MLILEFTIQDVKNLKPNDVLFIRHKGETYKLPILQKYGNQLMVSFNEKPYILQLNELEDNIITLVDVDTKNKLRFKNTMILGFDSFTPEKKTYKTKKDKEKELSVNIKSRLSKLNKNDILYIALSPNKGEKKIGHYVFHVQDKEGDILKLKYEKLVGKEPKPLSNKLKNSKLVTLNPNKLIYSDKFGISIPIKVDDNEHLLKKIYNVKVQTIDDLIKSTPTDEIDSDFIKNHPVLQKLIKDDPSLLGKIFGKTGSVGYETIDKLLGKYGLAPSTSSGALSSKKSRQPQKVRFLYRGDDILVDQTLKLLDGKEYIGKLKDSTNINYNPPNYRKGYLELKGVNEINKETPIVVTFKKSAGEVEDKNMGKGVVTITDSDI